MNECNTEWKVSEKKTKFSVIINSKYTVYAHSTKNNSKDSFNFYLI